MKILSIDVGMKNLALCLLDVDISKNYDIILWDTVNLCKDKDIKCYCNKKKGKCNANAIYHKNNIYYCKTHAKQHNLYKLPPIELKPNNIKKYKLIDLIKIAKSIGIEITNNKIKKIDCLEKILNKYDNDYYEFYIKKNTKDYCMVDYGIILKDKLLNIFKDIPIDLILIENQIGPLALRMKTLQGMIMQHFIESGITNIKEISASNKLKEYIGNKKTTYIERKKLSIDITFNIIKNNNRLIKFIDYYKNHKKKDDLADSLLQGLWYIKNIYI